MKKLIVVLCTLCITLNSLLSINISAEELDNDIVFNTLKIENGEELSENTKDENSIIQEFDSNEEIDKNSINEDISNQISNIEDIDIYSEEGVEEDADLEIDGIIQTTPNGLLTTTLSSSPITNTCGDSLTWSLDTDTGILTISGSGDMYNYDKTDNIVPWVDYLQDIKEVVLPDTITSIGDYAFWGCSNLHTVNLPNSLTYIGNYAFYNCFQDKDYFFSGSKWISSTQEYEYTDNYYDLVLPSNLTYIGDYAFANSSYSFVFLKGDIVIPSSVTYLGSYVFYYTYITSVDIKAQLSNVADGVFYECRYLKSISLPDSLTSIGNSAFYCTGLTSITLPDSLTSIGSNAFNYCTELTSISLPDSLASIGSSAFRSCNFTLLVIPDKVEAIGNSAFYYCDDLKEVTIGKSVKTIDDYAFESCDSLRKVIFLGDAPNFKDKWGNDLSIFRGDSFVAHYPVGNESWKKNVLLDYGGELVWSPRKELAGGIVCISGNANTIIVENYNNDSFKIVNENGEKLAIVIDENTEFIPSVEEREKDDIPQAINEKIDESLALNQKDAYMYLDLSYEVRNEFESGLISDLGVDDSEGIEYTIDLPADDFKDTDPEVIRIHDGNLDIIDSSYNKETSTLSFRTSKFSIYVIAEATEDYGIVYKNLFDTTNNSGNPASYNIYSDDIVFVAPSTPGYVFEGWYEDETLTTPINGVSSGSTGPVIVYAKWIAITYKINYVLNGGVNSVDNPSTYTMNDKNIVLSAPTKGLYVFKGWYLNPTFTGDSISFYIPSIPGDIYLYADWELAFDYKITYNLNGGLNNPSNIDGYDKGTTFKFLDPTKQGYKFNGWYLDSAFKKKLSSISNKTIGDLMLFAKWTPIKYSIKYNLNKGTNSKLNKTNYTVESNIDLQNPIKQGYTFVNWIDQYGHIVESTNNRFENLTLTANYSINNYNLTLNYNGGSVTKGTYINPNTTYTIESKITLPTLSKPGYKFDGWYNTSTNKKVTSISKLTGDINLEARLKSISPIDYSVCFMSSLNRLRIKSDEFIYSDLLIKDEIIKRFTSFKIDSVEYCNTKYFNLGSGGLIGTDNIFISGEEYIPEGFDDYNDYNNYLTKGKHTYSFVYKHAYYNGTFVLDIKDGEFYISSYTKQK